MDVGSVRDRVAALLSPLLLPPPPGAPPAWLEVTVPPPDLPDGAWTVELTEPRPLAPGRNLVHVRVAAGGRAARLTASVVCHAYGEAARARQTVAAGAALAAEQFLWEWVDLAAEAGGLAIGREGVTGQSAARGLAPGDRLREADLRPTPVVRQGEPVELSLGRGAVRVSVRATARQDGVVGQVITVRNELSGHLVAARVTGPGCVTWGR
jgi:flagella basal body P-ring formation protein FlgA